MTDIETTSADVLREIIERREATEYITRVGRLAEIAHLAVRMREAELAYQTASECIGLAACDACYAAAYDALVAALDAADDA